MKQRSDCRAAEALRPYRHSWNRHHHLGLVRQLNLSARQPDGWEHSRNFAQLSGMMERAGMSERAIYQRTKEVFEHFHLPFDSEPPES